MDITGELTQKKFSARQLVSKVFETDQYLIRQILDEDDKRAAEILIDRYYKTVYREIYIKTSDEELSLDLTQETFISILRALSQFDASKASFKTWIIRIAQNKVIDYRRSRYNHESIMTEVLEDYDEASSDCIEDNAINSMTKEKVMQILKKQDEVSERIFMMRAYEEHSFTQIAQMMGMNQGAVKARYYKTVKLIRKELEGYE